MAADTVVLDELTRDMPFLLRAHTADDLFPVLDWDQRSSAYSNSSAVSIVSPPASGPPGLVASSLFGIALVARLIANRDALPAWESFPLDDRRLVRTILQTARRQVEARVTSSGPRR